MSSFFSWDSFISGAMAQIPELFQPDASIYVARAPGRLDVLGGVADYSGGTVLEKTLAEATYAAIQPTRDRLIRVRTGTTDSGDINSSVEMPIHTLAVAGDLPSPESIRALLRENRDAAWSAYAIGCVYALLWHQLLDIDLLHGLNVYVDSVVPVGAGVSSSAALEVAVMSALCRGYSVDLDGLELARLCQWVENYIVGAPCGIMDQVTSAMGRAGELLVLKCQPHEILGYVRIPSVWEFVGIDSGVKHSVGGIHYTRARVAAFMGRKILETISGSSWGGYLCNVSPLAWGTWKERIPEQLGGLEFLEQFGELPDTVASVDPGLVYRVRSCAEHAILENDRVREFMALMSLAEGGADEQILIEAGRLMIESHDSYSRRIDLGSEETDLLVELAMDRGTKGGIYGAKITGGGSGGTVAILASGPKSSESIEEIRGEYLRRTGIETRLMTGSSPGAIESGTRVVN